MKKILLGFGLGLFLFAAVGCDKETVESASIDSREAIQFNAYLGKQATRFAPTTLTTLQGVGTTFPVWVYDQEGNLIQPVTPLGSDQTLNLYWTGSKWTYDGPILYYPIWNVEDPSQVVTDPNFTFISVYPEQAVSTGSSNWGFHFEADGQIDLIGAHNNTHATEVTLAFSHLLSRINFAVAAPKDVTVTISDIRLEDVYNQGDYSFGSGWTGQTGGILCPYTNQTGEIFTVTSTTSGEPVYLRTHSGSMQADVDNSLYLLPQTFDENAGTFNADAYIEFNFKLESETWKDANGDLMELTIGYIPVKAYLKDFVVNEWVEGSSYTYLIDFSRYLADGQIIFDEVTVAEWNPETITSTMTFEMLQLTQTALHEMIITTITEYYEVYPVSWYTGDKFLQNLIQVDQPLKEAVIIDRDELRDLYDTIYGNDGSLASDPHPYKMVIYLKNGVASELASQAFESLISLDGTCPHWDIAYYQEDMSIIGNPASDTPGVGISFYVIITPKTVPQP